MPVSITKRTLTAACLALAMWGPLATVRSALASEAPALASVSIAEGDSDADEAPAPSVEFEPADDAVAADENGMVDLAALASFAQTAAEEIQGQPVDVLDISRPFRPITQVTSNIALPPGLLPGQPGSEVEGAEPYPIPEFGDPRFWHGWAETNFNWFATAMLHKPLYFEEVNLERYGYTISPIIQPAISGAHFFLTIPILPYKIVAQPPRQEIYTLGYYRPGSPAPRRWHHVNWDPTAATVQGLWVTGLVFAIP